MANLPAIAKATRASASALAAQQRLGRRIEELERHLAQLVDARASYDPLRSGATWASEMRAAEAGIRDALDKATKARRAAHRRWANAQAVLAANPLPGDR
jgi:type II secretory pathway component PulJ